MTAQLTRNGKTRTVKNLGWLLRNWKDVEEFEIRDYLDGSARLIAALRDGGCYDTMFADKTVCREWVTRPVFIGLRCAVREAGQFDAVWYKIQKSGWIKLDV